MDGRPPKRQRRSVREDDSKRDSSKSIPKPVALASHPKSTRARPNPAPPTRQSASPSLSPSKPASSPKLNKSKSLHGFFQPATDSQRWSSQKFETKRSLVPTQETYADEIEDDYDSYDEIFSQHIASQTSSFNTKSSLSSNNGQTRASVSKPKAAGRQTNRPAKRFIMPPDSKSHSSRRSDPQPLIQTVDRRPWAQRFAPLNLDELAVHMRKVADVRKWLEEAFAGQARERLLVLRGPAGSGKTTTISLLSESLDFDIVEWKNPSVSEFTAQDYVSVGAQFEEFLDRGDRFGGLDLEDTAGDDDHIPPRSRDHRILLVEEFPTMLNRNAGLAAFRTSLQRYLASAADNPFGEIHPPVVMIVSETLLGSASSITDNFTVHRLLGPTLFNHPGTKIIDFNSIAPTFMQKALRLILEKEARSSKRARIPGPVVLETISEIGDIRSAVSSLEFLCLKGDSTGKWSGTLAKTKGKKARGDTALTPMEEESLKMISQRESSLGLFHAVGKIVYNKRLDPSLVPEGTTVLPSPPDYLSQHRRGKVSQVAVDALADETGTDITTFICGLHENYPPSCDGGSFTDSINACIEALSDSDILSADRRAPLNAGVDKLRQDEISYQVAARGLLFGLPYPVNRRLATGDGRSRPSDAHKMLYPSSLRLWRKTEEIEGLVDSWMNQRLDPFANPHNFSHDMGPAKPRGVKSWRNVRVGHQGPSGADQSATTVTMMSRADTLLHQLPYMAQIRRNEPESWQLNQITGIRSSRFDDVDEDELPSQSQSQPPRQMGRSAFGPRLPRKEEKLYLSDDDIVDD